MFMFWNVNDTDNLEVSVTTQSFLAPFKESDEESQKHEALN